VARLVGDALAPDAGTPLLATAGALAARVGLSASGVRVAAALRARCDAVGGDAFEPHFVALLAAAGGALQHGVRRALAAAHPDAAAGAALALALLDAAEQEGYLHARLAIAEAADALAAGRLPPAPCAPAAAARASAAAVLAALAAAHDASDVAGDAARSDATSSLGISEAEEEQEEEDDMAGSACAAAASAASLAAEEAGFIRFVADINLVSWRTISLLTLFVSSAHVYLWFAFMRDEPDAARLLHRGAVLRKQVAGTLFFDPADLAAGGRTMLDYPWPLVVSAAPSYIAFVVLVKMPAHAALLFLSCARAARPFVHRHYEALFFTLALLENASYPFTDAAAVRATGHVPVYEMQNCCFHTLGVFAFHSSGPFRLRCSAALLLSRLVAICAVTLLSGAAPLLLRPESAVQIAGLLLALALTPSWQRHLRARYALHAAAKRKKAA
jgi:hypothetical protein